MIHLYSFIREMMSEIECEIDQKMHFKQAGRGAFKGFLSSVPFVGSSIIGAWDSYWNSRFQETVEQLSKAVEKIGEEKIDKQYVESEEFIDLFHAAILSRLQSRSQKKAKFILGMLVESMQKDRDARFQTSDKESFLFILGRLTEREMDFLSRFSQGEYRGKSKNDIYQISEELGFAIDGLLINGIIREDGTWEKHLIESMLGRKFIAYLKTLAISP